MVHHDEFITEFKLVAAMQHCCATICKNSIFSNYFALSLRELSLWKNVIFAFWAWGFNLSFFGPFWGWSLLKMFWFRCHFWHFTALVNDYVTSAYNLIRCSTMIHAIRRAHCLWAFIIIIHHSSLNTTLKSISILDCVDSRVHQSLYNCLCLFFLQ